MEGHCLLRREEASVPQSAAPFLPVSKEQEPIPQPLYLTLHCLPPKTYRLTEFRPDSNISTILVSSCVQEIPFAFSFRIAQALGRIIKTSKKYQLKSHLHSKPPDFSARIFCCHQKCCTEGPSFIPTCFVESLVSKCVSVLVSLNLSEKFECICYAGSSKAGLDRLSWVTFFRTFQLSTYLILNKCLMLLKALYGC